MNIISGAEAFVPFRSPAQSLGSLNIDVAALAVAAAADVTIVIDSAGIIRDVALGGNGLPKAWITDWIGRAWIDTVSIDGRTKIEQMLADAASGEAARWRQVNHSSSLGELPVRYLTLRLGSNEGVIAVGREMRTEAALQQRLLQAQQSIERDYVRLRQAEARYRMLFEQSSEAVLIVDTATRSIVDANPAAYRLVDVPPSQLSGKALTSLLAPPSRDVAVSLLGAVAGAEQTQPMTVRLIGSEIDYYLSACLFRQDRGSCFLVRLMTLTQSESATDDRSKRLFDVLDRLPDAFVVTDDAMMIIAENNAFLDLTQLARKEQSRGQPIARFLGRPGIDLNLMMTQLREHGVVRNFSTITRGAYNAQDEVEVSAVAVTEGDQPCYGFCIRNVGRRLTDLQVTGRDLPRSVEQLTELVGRVSLKEIVRESTDLIERLCIEAALTYTEDNRASAADILGLSRQSLYSKLHRHGLGNLRDDQ
ncbi:MAG: transcriptional regulator PpsR [Sphingomonadaceae bacterium]